jgi:hypothetical protein
MGYKNCCSVGYEVERCLSGCYDISSHGDLSGFYSSIHNADLPMYVNMSVFYRQSEHELFSDVKYDKVNLRYDDGSRHIRDMVRGPPIEAYVPSPVAVPDGFTANSRLIKEPDIRIPEIMPKAAEEILRAQAQVLGQNDMMIRASEIVEELYLKRTIRKIEILKKPEQTDKKR